MKPQSVYFTVDLSQRPPAESKRGAVLRAFAVAAKDAVIAAIEEGSLPDVVLVMVTLAPRPVLPEGPKPEACGCESKTALCSSVQPGRFLPEYCLACGHKVTCHKETA